jgi:hypothetical protein
MSTILEAASESNYPPVLDQILSSIHEWLHEGLHARHISQLSMSTTAEEL